MKKLLQIVFLLSLCVPALSQPHENSWINYGQEYYKIKIWQTGVYRLTPNALALAGFSTSIDPRKIQLYKNGVEQYIYVQGEGDGSFDHAQGDFVEFFGEPNDGLLDSRLYDSSHWQPSTRFSLFTDTSVYFLTYNPLANGRRVTLQTDTSYSLYTPSQYFLKETVVDGNALRSVNPIIFGYNRGKNDQSIDYTESEGWGIVFGNYSGTTNSVTIPVATDKVFSGGPDAEVFMSISGVNNKPHNIQVTFPGINLTDVFINQTLRKYNYAISASSLTSPTSSYYMTCTTPNPAANPDYSMLHSLTVKYPHTYNLEGQNNFLMYVPDGTGKSYLEISNFNGGGNDAIMYDVTNNRRITVAASGSLYKALVDNGGIKKCYIVSQSSVLTPGVSKISYVANNPGRFNNFGPMAIDSAFIIITHKSLWNDASFYHSYRNTQPSTANRSIMVDVEELYDQFAFGIRKHPLSIKNFSRYVLDTWPTEAQHMFLIGKSISPADIRLNPSYFEASLVASYGVPTSDLLLTSGINGADWEPKIPVGRLSANNGADVSAYLHKVMEYEAAQSGPPQEWMKEILHFGGGNNPNEQAQLAGYLSGYESILEDSSFGGNVTTYLKVSNDPIVANLSDTLQAKIDNGVALMTFFGHASGSGFDASTDEPTKYNNHGRYPMIVANSCFAGDFHTGQKSISEKFVLQPEKAAIGFLASVGLGTPYYLSRYTTALFQHASYYSYGSSIGQLMKKAVQEIQVFNSSGDKQVAEEMSLQGDPSLKLNVFGKPDYVLNESSFTFNPSRISTDIDSFEVKITVRNYGRAVNDPFFVKVKHTYPNGVDSVYYYQRPYCHYVDEFSATLYTGGFSGAGVNKLTVDVDIPDMVDEYVNLANNSASSEFFITSKDIIPVYPPDYAIHPENIVTLKASTANPLTALTTYKFEIDTIDLNQMDETAGAQPSPMYRFTSMADSGGILSWSPPAYTLLDSTVYFWRVANDSIQYDTVNFHWQQNSFMYIEGKTGWAQSHFHQFKSNKYNNVRYDTLGREFKFVNDNKALRVTTFGAPGSLAEFNQIGYFFNNSPMEYNGCQTTAAVMVAVLDSVTLMPWNTCNYNVGQANTFTPLLDCSFSFGTGSCRSRAENYFIFRLNNPAAMSSFQAFINSVPANNYIILYSWFTYPYSTADPAFFNTITSLGFNTGALQDNLPFIYFVRKGDLSTAGEMHGNNTSDTLEFNRLLQTVWDRGTINSVIVGPTTRWESLHWDQLPVEAQSYKDKIHLNILGLNSGTNSWDTLAGGIQYASGRDTSLSWISASSYPFIQLQSYLEDDSLLTPAQIQYWRIYYDEVPECAVNPNRSYSFYDNPLQEGDTLKLSVAIDNLTSLPMDSLGVSFYLYDKSRIRHEITAYKLDSLRGNQYLTASLAIDSTFGLAGDNSLWLEVNPHNVSSLVHQPEKYHFNNFLEVKFRIDRDKVNPILDVTFDGVHILNGDIVSGKPEIAIQLHDDNRFLALNDTSKFNVYITPPGSSTKQLIDWSSAAYGQVMRFTPASLPKNSCRIDWNPTFSEDGIYYLEVNARDMSNNESGKYNYRISFEVINRSTITEVLNYPNPFSTSTRFVFTLTGNEIPTGMKIQIMTVSGKIVREILQHELGNIHVGRNITDYAWDGKDEYGDQLANGLYLYRVVTELHGKKIEHRETDVDKYFKKGWGKMYLLR